MSVPLVTPWSREDKLACVHKFSQQMLRLSYKFPELDAYYVLEFLKASQGDTGVVRRILQDFSRYQALARRALDVQPTPAASSTTAVAPASEPRLPTSASTLQSTVSASPKPPPAAPLSASTASSLAAARTATAALAPSTSPTAPVTHAGPHTLAVPNNATYSQTAAGDIAPVRKTYFGHFLCKALVRLWVMNPSNTDNDTTVKLCVELDGHQHVARDARVCNLFNAGSFVSVSLDQRRLVDGTHHRGWGLSQDRNLVLVVSSHDQTRMGLEACMLSQATLIPVVEPQLVPNHGASSPLPRCDATTQQQQPPTNHTTSCTAPHAATGRPHSNRRLFTPPPPPAPSTPRPPRPSAAASAAAASAAAASAAAASAAAASAAAASAAAAAQLASAAPHNPPLLNIVWRYPPFKLCHRLRVFLPDVEVLCFPASTTTVELMVEVDGAKLGSCRTATIYKERNGCTFVDVHERMRGDVEGNFHQGWRMLENRTLVLMVSTSNKSQMPDRELKIIQADLEQQQSHLAKSSPPPVEATPKLQPTPQQQMPLMQPCSDPSPSPLPTALAGRTDVGPRTEGAKRQSGDEQQEGSRQVKQRVSPSQPPLKRTAPHNTSTSPPDRPRHGPPASRAPASSTVTRSISTPQDANQQARAGLGQDQFASEGLASASTFARSGNPSAVVPPTQLSPSNPATMQQADGVQSAKRGLGSAHQIRNSQAPATHGSLVSVNVSHQLSTADPAAAPLAQSRPRAASMQPIPACQAAGPRAVPAGPLQGFAAGAGASQLPRAMGRDIVSQDRIAAAHRKFVAEGALMREQLAQIVPRYTIGPSSLIEVTCLGPVGLNGQEEGGQSSSSSSGDEQSEGDEGHAATEDEEETGGGEGALSEVEGDEDDTESEGTEDEEDANEHDGLNRSPSPPPSRPPGLPPFLPSVPPPVSNVSLDNAQKHKTLQMGMSSVLVCVELPRKSHAALWNRITHGMLPNEISRFLHGPYPHLCARYAAYDVPGMEEIVTAMLQGKV